jgi:hypothetical protein
MPEYKAGDRIRLNGKAREWTKGYVFVVDAVRPFGLRCTVAAPPGMSGVHYNGCGAIYMALWDEVEGKVADGEAVELRGM